MFTNISWKNFALGAIASMLSFFAGAWYLFDVSPNYVFLCWSVLLWALYFFFKALVGHKDCFLKWEIGGLSVIGAFIFLVLPRLTFAGGMERWFEVTGLMLSSVLIWGAIFDPRPPYDPRKFSA